jgi:GWxTD domain-containing protein
MGRAAAGRGGRLLRFLLGYLLVTSLAVESARAARPRDSVGPASVGDLRYHARAVPFRHGEKEARAEFSIRVPYDQVKFMPKDSVLQADLRITVELKTMSGKSVGRQQQTAVLQVMDQTTAQDSLLGEVYTVGLAAPPGEYRFKVLVEDLNVARQGLVYIMKSQKRQGEVNGVIDLGKWLFAKPAVSGILPAWSIRDQTEETRFAKGPYDVQPQPSGYYGLYQNVLSAYYEIYDRTPPPEGRRYRLTSRIVAAKGDTVFTSQDSLRVTEGEAWPHALAIDVSSLPAGHYWLQLSLDSSDPDSRPARSATEFDILWSRDSWTPYAADGYEVSARVLLSAEDEIGFRALPMGEKETRIDSLWRSVDPTPDTAENEAYREFQRRIEHANANYTVFDKGMFSDRGRVYIRYGEPDEIRIERLPVNDRTLGFAITNEIPKESQGTLSNPNSGIVDTRPYEIWSYQLRGQELVPRQGLSETGHELKFVFVDEQGYGDYILRYSSATDMH